MSGKSGVTLSLAKEAINGGSDASLCSDLDLEGQCSALCFTTEDRKEEVAALMEKRKPESRGNRKLSPTVSVTIQ
jgi:enoyl-CoA hydratase/carnithine racemase